MQMSIKAFYLHEKLITLGFRTDMNHFERRKLSVFNLLNFFGFLIGCLLPVIGLSSSKIELSLFAWSVCFAPAMVSVLVLVLNYYRLSEIAALAYFTLYPLLTAMVYMVSFDVGIELFFILYGVLSVFFLQRFWYIVFAYFLAISCYFFVFVFIRDYSVQIVHLNYSLYVLNHVLPACFIFWALFLIKRENTQYQTRLILKNKELQEVNMEIQRKNALIDEKARQLQKQNELIDDKAKQLQQQAHELTELNTMKNKLFSVISHDLKTPLYALRNLFRSVQKYDLPAEDIKNFVPEVVLNLNYTTALMENLLIWVKSQMQITVRNPQLLEVKELVKESTDLLSLQASSKRIEVRSTIDQPAFIYADKDMINLVIRNLLSNAIKFTPIEGLIIISMEDKGEVIRISIKDNGVGMDEKTLGQLFENTYHSTKGTAEETGTGLGLMLCKDFLLKNGGDIRVESSPGKGSTFSFTLPKK
jgi:signal transduction histidine kinase